MKKILTIFGTRPEAIKLAPLIRLLSGETEGFDLVNCVTAQHRQMLDQVLAFFKIKPEIDLNLMKPNQSLSSLTAEAINQIVPVLQQTRPDLVIVQGDTTTAFVAALAAFYQKVPVAHVEAGLRTNDIYAPFPEEINRRLISSLASFHFAPTQTAAEALEHEGVDRKKILVTGNTVVDALLEGLNLIELSEPLRNDLEKWFWGLASDPFEKIILITGHRRESFGEAFRSICFGIRELSLRYPKIGFVYPVHLNPNVQQPVNEILGNLKNVVLIEPVEYPKMLYLMTKATLILTDSGGIQEEAPTLKIPVLVMREKTERPEGVALGTSILVGNHREKIVTQTSAFLENRDLYRRAQAGKNPYGDGKASERIVQFLREALA